MQMSNEYRASPVLWQFSSVFDFQIDRKVGEFEIQTTAPSLPGVIFPFSKY